MSNDLASAVDLAVEALRTRQPETLARAVVDLSRWDVDEVYADLCALIVSLSDAWDGPLPTLDALGECDVEPIVRAIRAEDVDSLLQHAGRGEGVIVMRLLSVAAALQPP